MLFTRILLISSDTSITRDLQELLKGLGYNAVTVAVSNEEAITKIEKFKPEIIITDIHLRGRDKGIKTGSLIQSNFNIPVIYVAENIGQATIQRAKSTGPFGFLYRPFNDKQVLVTIETALTRHQLENELRESRQWLNTTLASIGDGVIATDENGLVRFINPAAVELTGWDRADSIGRSVHEIFKVSDGALMSNLDISKIRKKTARLEKNDFEGILLSRNRKPTPVEANATLITGEGSELYGMVLVFRDITKQREVLSEIQRQAGRAKALEQVALQISNQIKLDNVLSTICAIANRTLRANGTAIFLLDVQKGVFRNMNTYTDSPSFQIYANSDAEVPREIFEGLLSRENPVIVIPDMQVFPKWPFSQIAGKGDVRSLVISALFARNTLTGILVSFFTGSEPSISQDDIALLRGLTNQASSAIKNAELFEQLRASRERQQFLARQLVRVQEDEKQNLARELHDEIGQLLTGLQFTIKSALSDSEEIRGSQLDQAQAIVRTIISQIRELSIELRPSLLDDLGLLPTLDWYFKRYEGQTGIRVNFQHLNLDRRFSAELEIAAFRIVQEALTNTARYAGVEAVDIKILVLDAVMQIEIKDEGCGFDVTGLNRIQSLGLEGMRERAYAIGGLLNIQSEPGKGTRIQATLPFTGLIERRNRERDYTPGG